MKRVLDATVPPPAVAVRWLRVIRWVLPIFLASVAFAFEVNEHLLQDESELSPALVGEVLIFAMLGPVVIAFTLGWVSRLVAGYQATATALVEVNRGLEEKVAERTRNLEAAGRDLASANADLSSANDELRQLDRLKSEFVSLVSHQLRAPLTNINGALELVADDAALLPASSRRTLEILTSESARLSHLIQTILDVSRIESGRLTPRMGAVAVEPLLTRTCQSTMAAQPARPWSIDVAPALPPAWADEILLEEVVRNLLENALRYAPADRPVEVTSVVTDGAVEITVADHGPGIPVAEQAKIFRSFHRLDADDSSATGYGLGLYFADRLIHAQGGTIRVESPIHDDPSGPGSRFVIRLALAGEEPEADRPMGSA